MAKLKSIASALSGSAQAASATRMTAGMRVNNGVLEIVHAIPVGVAFEASLSEGANKLKGKPLCMSTRGLPVRFQYTVPNDWPEPEVRGKVLEIVLTATVGAVSLTALESTFAEVPATAKPATATAK